MNRYEQAVAYHHKGFNCCQSVLAAYSDLTGRPSRPASTWGAGLAPAPRPGSCAGPSPAPFSPLAAHPGGPPGPCGQQAPAPGALAKEFQKRFQEKFGDLRCKPLLKAGIQATDATPVARDMALTNRCDVLIITAMEIVEEMRGENA